MFCSKIYKKFSRLWWRIGVCPLMKILIPEKKKELNQGLHVLKKTDEPSRKKNSKLPLQVVRARSDASLLRNLYIYLSFILPIAEIYFCTAKKHLFSYWTERKIQTSLFRKNIKASFHCVMLNYSERVMTVYVQN